MEHVYFHAIANDFEPLQAAGAIGAGITLGAVILAGTAAGFFGSVESTVDSMVSVKERLHRIVPIRQYYVKQNKIYPYNESKKT